MLSGREWPGADSLTCAPRAERATVGSLRARGVLGSSRGDHRPWRVRGGSGGGRAPAARAATGGRPSRTGSGSASARRAAASTRTTTSPRTSRTGSSRSSGSRSRRKIEEVLQALVIDTESDHNTQDTARRVAKMYLMEVFAGRYVAQPPVTEFPNIAPPERADDRRPGHGAQRLLAPPLPDHRPDLGRRDAERALRADRAVEVRPPRGVGDGPAADPGRGDHPARRPAAGQDAARRPRRSSWRPTTTACSGAA